MPDKKNFRVPNSDSNAYDNNQVENYMEEVDTSWSLGTYPTGEDDTKITTKAIGNGQLGVGIKAPMLDVATPLVLPPAIVVVLSVPAMYTVDGKPSAMAYAIKDMFESHAKQVSGIDPGYNMEAIGNANVGADSQVMNSPGKVTRSQLTPTFNFTEISGNLYWNLIRKWMWDMNNPDTYGIGPNVSVQGGWTMSDYSMTFMAIQPDVTQRPDRIIDAAVFCNVFPTSTGELGMERNVATMKPMERSFVFNAIYQHNAYTKQLGKIVMEKLAMNTLDFNWAPPQRNVWTKNLDDAGLNADTTARKTVYSRNETDPLAYKIDEEEARSNDKTLSGNVKAF